MSKLLRVARLSKSAEIRTADYGECLSTSVRFLDAMRSWAAVVTCFTTYSSTGREARRYMGPKSRPA